MTRMKKCVLQASCAYSEKVLLLCTFGCRGSINAFTWKRWKQVLWVIFKFSRLCKTQVTTILNGLMCWGFCVQTGFQVILYRRVPCLKDVIWRLKTLRSNIFNDKFRFRSILFWLQTWLRISFWNCFWRTTGTQHAQMQAVGSMFRLANDIFHHGGKVTSPIKSIVDMPDVRKNKLELYSLLAFPNLWHTHSKKQTTLTSLYIKLHEPLEGRTVCFATLIWIHLEKNNMHMSLDCCTCWKHTFRLWPT